MKRIEIGIKSDTPLPSKVAWWIACHLPDSIQQAAFMKVLGSAGAIAKKGMDATLSEVLKDCIDLRGDVEWDKPTEVSFERHNNISHCCASGCDGVACQETGKPWRIGDF